MLLLPLDVQQRKKKFDFPPIFLPLFPLPLAQTLTKPMPPYPTNMMKKKERNYALGWLYRGRSKPLYHTFGQGRVALSPAFYKYKGRTRERGGDFGGRKGSF